MAQEQLLKDLVKSFMTAFFLVGLTMVVLNRSIIGGVLSVIPNVFPVSGSVRGHGTHGLAH